MGPRSLQWMGAAGWTLARRQHWAISRTQLLALGLGAEAIRHRLTDGRLHQWRWRGVYAVGRPDLSRHGGWMAALLACGPAAVLSHESAAAFWGVIPTAWLITCRFRCTLPAADLVSAHIAASGAGRPCRLPRSYSRDGLACTLVDLSARVRRPTLERAVNEADGSTDRPRRCATRSSASARYPAFGRCGSCWTARHSGSRTPSSSAASWGSPAGRASAAGDRASR